MAYLRIDTTEPLGVPCICDFCVRERESVCVRECVRKNEKEREKVHAHERDKEKNRERERERDTHTHRKRKRATWRAIHS